MTTGHVLLGLLAEGDRHGYDLKHDHDSCFPAARPLAFGQVYAALERLTKKGLVTEVETVRVDGPDRRIYSLTTDGHRALTEWLDEIEEPAPHVANPLAVKATIALLAADESTATQYLRRQRDAHLQAMRRYTQIKSDPQSPMAVVLAADYAIAHLDADLGWLENALERVAALGDTQKKETAR